MALGQSTYSQLGEDILINLLLPKSNGFYVDVGAHDPYRFSNTALLHDRGWSGINIDADERAIEKFRLIRPNDININIGIGDKHRIMEFCVFNDGALNSFDPKIADGQIARFGEPQKKYVQVDTLANVLRQYKPEDISVDYLNIDCEGLDYIVLSSNDWSSCRPSLISIEIHNLNLLNPIENDTVKLLLQLGYRFVGHYFVTAFFQLN